jgi:hypothetical protein
MTGREARLVARLVEDTVRPGGALPPVGQTDAVAAFDALLRAGPRLNRLVLRAVLHARGRPAGLGDVLARLAAYCYFGDADVMRRLGYDAGAVVDRAAAIRLAEGRP